MDKIMLRTHKDVFSSQVMKRAREHFTEGCDEHARVYREIATMIGEMEIDQPNVPRSVEVSKEFVRELMKFVQDNPDRIA